MFVQLCVCRAAGGGCVRTLWGSEAMFVRPGWAGGVPVQLCVGVLAALFAGHTFQPQLCAMCCVCSGAAPLPLPQPDHVWS